MKTMQVIPVGYHIVVGYSMKDLQNLKVIMDNMTFNMNGDDPKHVEANKYLHEVFYPELHDTLKELTPNVFTPDPE
jgi:hypothetical protein